MLVNNGMYLFKTPLDSNHNNIIDFIPITDNGEMSFEDVYDYKQLYYFILISEFEHIFIDFTNKGIKNNGIYSTITVPYSYEQLQGYNYVSFNGNDGDIIYMFITDMTSENDNPDRPSTTLHLVMDFWANSLNTFYKSPQYNYLTTSHKKRINITTNNEVSYIERIYNVETSGEGNGKTKEVYRDGSGKRVVWIKATFNTNFNDDNGVYPYISIVNGVCECEVRNDNGVIQTIHNAYIGAVQDYSKNITAYIPYCLIDDDGDIIYEFTIYPTGTGDFIFGNEDNYIRFVNNPRVINTKKLFNFVTSQNSYINNLELTFYSPIHYTIDEDETNGVKLEVNMPVAYVDDFVPFISKMYPVGVTESYSAIFNHNYLLDFYQNITFTPKSMGFTPIDTARLRDVRYCNLEVDPCNFVKPIHYNYLYFNNEKIELQPFNEREPHITVNIDLTTGTPLVQPSYLPSYAKIGNKTFIHNSGQIGICVLAKDDYLIRNGAQLEQSLQQARTNATLESFSAVGNAANNWVMRMNSRPMDDDDFRANAIGYGIVAGVEAGIGITKAVVKYNQTKNMVDAKLEDLGDTPTVCLPSTGAGDNYYQDSIRMFSVDCTDDYLIKRIQINNFMFGSSRESYEDIRYVTRRVFDFNKTANCSLVGIYDNQHRRLLEEMFNGGVFRHHVIINPSNQGQYIFDNTFSKNPYTVWNIEKEFETNPVYKAMLPKEV